MTAITFPDCDVIVTAARLTELAKAQDADLLPSAVFSPWRASMAPYTEAAATHLAVEVAEIAGFEAGTQLNLRTLAWLCREWLASKLRQSATGRPGGIGASGGRQHGDTGHGQRDSCPRQPEAIDMAPERPALEAVNARSSADSYCAGRIGGEGRGDSAPVISAMLFGQNRSCSYEAWRMEQPGWTIGRDEPT